MKIGILFGSSSNEHEVSVVSASSIIKNIDHEKYEVIPIYLGKKNNFYLWEESIEKIEILPFGQLPTNLKKLENPFEYLKKFDLIFIMIHGKNGEDGIISSILTFLNIPYVGNKTMASVVTMDKILTKEIIESNGIITSSYLYFTKYNNEYLYKDKKITKRELYNEISKKLKYPVFVKPASNGSSVGVTKVTSESELDHALEIALRVDHRILVETAIIGKEIECGILEKDDDLIVSVLGEVKSAEDFYSYNAKYTNSESNTIIPAAIDSKTTKKIQAMALKAFQILDCHIYSRCDFFLSDDGKIIFNEINTIPGFTEISMYPKLFASSGISYPELIDTLIISSLENK